MSHDIHVLGVGYLPGRTIQETLGYNAHGDRIESLKWADVVYYNSIWHYTQSCPRGNIYAS